MDPDRFHQYLNEKLKALKEYLTISESRRVGLNLPDIEEVTRWMAKRQELISRINRMDEEITKISREASLFGAEWPERLREEVLFLSGAINEVLQRVRRIDEECQERLALLRDEVTAELQKTFQGISAVQSYLRKPAYSSRLLDVRRCSLLTPPTSRFVSGLQRTKKNFERS